MKRTVSIHVFSIYIQNSQKHHKATVFTSHLLAKKDTRVATRDTCEHALSLFPPNQLTERTTDSVTADECSRISKGLVDESEEGGPPTP